MWNQTHGNLEKQKERKKKKKAKGHDSNKALFQAHFKDLTS